MVEEISGSESESREEVELDRDEVFSVLNLASSRFKETGKVDVKLERPVSFGERFRLWWNKRKRVRDKEGWMEIGPVKKDSAAKEAGVWKDLAEFEDSDDEIDKIYKQLEDA